MAVITINTETTGLAINSRLRHWAKVARHRYDVNLDVTDSYSWAEPLRDWNTAVALNPGEFLLVASELGRDYRYRLLRVTNHGVEAVTDLEIDGAIQRAWTTGDLNEKKMAKIKNSLPYRLAAFAWLSLADRTPKSEESPIKKALAAVAALTEDEQVEIRNRLLWRWKHDLDGELAYKQVQ